MTPYEVTNDVISRMPPGARLPELTDHENAEMYKAVCRAVKAHREGKPPALRINLRDVPQMQEDLRTRLREQESDREQDRGQQ